MNLLVFFWLFHDRVDLENKANKKYYWCKCEATEIKNIGTENLGIIAAAACKQNKS